MTLKLSCALLLALVALVCADTEYSNYQYSYPQEAQSAPSQYYGQRRRQATGLAGLVRGLFRGDDNRRQFNPLAGVGGLLGGNLAGLLGALLLAMVGIAVLAAAFASIDFNSSGRGLDTDEWEVDHSVWMNQLQKDFEESWSTE